MKPSSPQRTTQLLLAWETSESRIWETLESAQQRQLVEHLARLWIQHVLAEQARAATPVSASHDS